MIEFRIYGAKTDIQHIMSSKKRKPVIPSSGFKVKYIAIYFSILSAFSSSYFIMYPQKFGKLALKFNNQLPYNFKLYQLGSLC